MKRAIDVLPVEDAEYKPFKMDVREPGNLRGIMTTVQPPSSIIPTSMGQPAQAELIPIPALAFEVDPTRETRERSFVWLPAGLALDYPGNLVYRDKYVDERTGQPVFLYESIPEGKGRKL